MEQKSTSEPNKVSTENEILELAKKELLRDIKCASLRAEQFGAHKWADKPQKFKPNRRFLRHMLVNTSRQNERNFGTSRDISEHMENAKMSSKTPKTSRKEKHVRRKRSRWDNDEDVKNQKHTGHHEENEKKKHRHEKHKST